MRVTAAVINAGLGDISLGLEMAGFKVVAAYEADKKALELHSANLKAPIYPLSVEEIDANAFPEVDLLAARLHLPPFSRSRRAMQPSCESSIYKLYEILSLRKARAFFLMLNAASAKNKQLQELLDTIATMGYECIWKSIDVAQATGLPIKERTVCIAGTLRSTEKLLEFPSQSALAQEQLEQYLQLNQPVDPWYFHIRPDNILRHRGESRLYCWKNLAYVEADLVQWNYRQVPLVNTQEGLRKITHREIANLKGFPAHYTLSDGTNRQWLYQKLMYAGNVFVIKQIASMVNPILTDNPWRSKQAERGMWFENLVGRYLVSLAGEEALAQELRIKDRAVDFALYQGSKTLYFEVKYYNGRLASAAKIRTVCERLSPLRADGVPILVLANEVPDYVKAECLDQLGVYIWDVGSLLWLFDKFADIKNDFIASLDYAIEHIEPKPPIPDVFQGVSNASEEKREKLGWKEKLLRIAPGREQFQEYEAACIEILKYVLGDYLTLWEAQEPANDGLYRFDLCCKIKSGANQDFFDTIKHYFNTKYIVFEFKNYSQKISQKEIYTTEKYLYEKALRKVAIIISRWGADEHALQAARGSLRETGKLILCLSDNALLEMVDIKTREEQEPAEFLGALLDDLLVHLEK